MSKPRRSGRARLHEERAASYFAALAAHDTVAAAEHWHPDGVDDFVPVRVLRGPVEVREFFDELYTAVPDCALRVESLLADTTGAAVRWRLTGTFAGGQLLGFEPTGRRVELRGCDCLVFDEDGNITQNTAYYDGAAFARGIGLLPREDGSADRALRAGFNAVTRLRAALARRTGEAS